MSIAKLWFGWHSHTVDTLTGLGDILVLAFALQLTNANDRKPLLRLKLNQTTENTFVYKFKPQNCVFPLFIFGHMKGQPSVKLKNNTSIT